MTMNNRLVRRRNGRKFGKHNPRFVIVVALEPTQEVYPDIPDGIDDDGVCIWDRQEKKKVATIHADYQQLICLELNRNAESQPFTNLERWLNSLSNAAMSSENIPPTK